MCRPHSGLWRARPVDGLVHERRLRDEWEAAPRKPTRPPPAAPPPAFMKALFDTNILIDYLNGLDASRTELGRYQERLISVVTWMELLIGGRSEDETDVIDMFLRDFRVVEITGRSLGRPWT